MKSSGVDRSSKENDSKQGEETKDPAFMGDLRDLPIRKPDTERFDGRDIMASKGDPAE